MVKKGKKTSNVAKKKPEYGTDWNEAVKRCGIFESNKVVIAIICKHRPCECGNGEVWEPLHYVVSEKKKNSNGKFSWQIVSTHTLDSDKQKCWEKYGNPNEFVPIFGHFQPGEVVKPIAF